MSKRDDYEESLILLGFGYDEVKTFATMSEDVSVKDLSIEGGSSGKILSQLFAAEAMDKIDCSLIREGWIAFHEYLKTGVYDHNKHIGLMNRVANLHNEWQAIANDFKEAGQADKDGFGAPIILFVNGYAYHMLKAIYNLEGYFKESDVPEIQRKTEREHLQRYVRKIDPDAGNALNPPAP